MDKICGYACILQRDRFYAGYEVCSVYMALIDEIIIHAKAGKGGDGVVRWLHTRGKELAGPSGGNGGNGGNVFIRAVPDINRLSQYRGLKKFAAVDGGDGQGNIKRGANGSDIYIEVPRGSIVTNRHTLETYEVLRSGETVQVLKGGRGGAGNAVFKSSVNRSPKEFTPGARGEEADLYIELRLIADAGLIGLPNAGKSSLLNEITGASAKVGSYAFTTLEANLGMFGDFVLADIPGLIEGASQGRGLGNKFLKHIFRTSLLLHCISLESENPLDDYIGIRKELEQWNPALLERSEIVILTKSDTRDTLYSQQISDIFRQTFGEDKLVLTVSILEHELMQKLKRELSKKLSQVVDKN